MIPRFVESIWHIRGRVPLAPGQSSDEAFGRLMPLFGQPGTSHERTGDTLVFQKKDQAAQDKMSVFDSGRLEVERDETGPMLRYHLISRMLLFCFLAPLLFLGIAQLTKAMVHVDKSASHSAKSGKDADAKKDQKKERKVVPLNPIDKFLGAPEPEKPKKDKKDEGEEGGKKPSPTPAYVFAAIFAVLYVVGRVIEDRMIRALFSRRLLEADVR